MSVILGNPGSGAGQTTLQGAYDNSMGADPQILLDNVPTPISIEAAVSGAVLEIRDVGNNSIMFEVDADPDLIVARTGITVEDAFLNGAATSYLTFADTFTTGGGYLGGCILSNGTVTYDNSFFIWALLQESKTYAAAAGPGFAAFTLFNALCSIQNSGNFDLVQALILNNGVVHNRTTAGTSNTTQTVGLSNSPQTRASVAGAIMTKTGGDSGVVHRPTFSTVGGSTVNFGTSRGLWHRDIAVALFQPSAGVENVTANIAVEVDALVTGGNITKRALRSALTAATNTLMIENTGGAASDFGAGGIHFDDGAPVQFGGAAFNAQDASIFWSPSNYLSMFFTANNDDLRFTNPAAGRFLINNIDGNAGEYNFNCGRFSFGDSTGAVGNQVGNFVTPARTITVAGEWADFLLTQGGNLTVNGNSMSRVSAWVINGISYASSTGTVTNADTLTVGGFPTSSPGVTITNRHSLNVIGGRSRLASTIQVPPINPSALGAGDNNNWGGLLTGSANNNMREWARITGNATTSVITGIDSGAAQDGDSFTLTNIGAETILLSHQDTASTDVNRIITPDGQNYVLSENRSANIRYDATTERWRVITAPAAVAPLTGEWQYDDTTTQADPGNGNFRTDNNTVGSVTELYINDETKPGTDAGNILAAVASGDQIYLQNKEDASEFLVFDVTANIDQTGWHEIQGTVNASGANFTDGKEFLITVLFA